MNILLREQDVIDACCVFLSARSGRPVEEMQVDLHFDEEKGIWGEARVGYQNEFLAELDVIDAIAVYLSETRQINPSDVLIDLFYEDPSGFGATVEVTR
jgi:hypothetical protein